jgi:cation diffusion facilitator CzcD-associated flavoprotein CzcO
MGITKWDPWQITYGGIMSDRIVIVGGGFAGVKCARTLRKLLPDNCDIVLFNREKPHGLPSTSGRSGERYCPAQRRRRPPSDNCSKECSVGPRT